MTALLKLDEVARQLRLSPWYVRRELASGNLRGSKVAGHWRIPAEAVDEYLAANSNQQQAAPVAPVTRRRRRRSA